MSYEQKAQELAALYALQSNRQELAQLNAQKSALTQKMNEHRIKPKNYKTNRKEEVKKQEVQAHENIDLRSCAVAPVAELGALAACIVLAVLLFKVHFLASIAAVIVGIVAYDRLYVMRSKKQDANLEAVHAQITTAFQQKLEEAEALDRKEKERYKADCEQDAQKLRQEYMPQIEELDRKITQLDLEYRSKHVLSPEDAKHISRIIQLMESYRADSIKESLQIIDKENQEKDRQQKELEDQLAWADFYAKQEMQRQLEESRNRLENTINQVNQRLEDQKKVDDVLYELKKLNNS